MKKLLKITGIIIGSLVMFLFIFALFFVNKENLSFESDYKSIQTETLKNNQDLYVVYIFSPDCPAIRKKGPYLKEDFDWLKENGIDYYLVADVIYNSRVDRDLNQIREKYNLEEEHFYLMDTNEFPINGGLFNDKVRYGSFVEELTGSREIPLGYINHIIMKDGKLISFAPYLEKDKLQTVK